MAGGEDAVQNEQPKLGICGIINMRCAILLLIPFFAFQGCDVAQDRVYIYTNSSQSGIAFNTNPTQAALIKALQKFAESHDTRCRQHVKRWDEWSCDGPGGIRITFEPDRGKDRYIGEFTLVTGSSHSAAELRHFVGQFAGFMDAQFGDAVLYVAE